MEDKPILDKNKTEFIKLNNLINQIVYENRFSLSDANRVYLDSILKYSDTIFNSILKRDTLLFRSRINKINLDNLSGEDVTHPIKDMGAPPKALAAAGRINPVGIPYLYCSGEEKTAGAESRPDSGNYITIAKINVLKDLKIADFTVNFSGNELSEYFQILCSVFSTQWPAEYKNHYLISQYLASHLKTNGFRGIKYKSEVNADGTNFALFHKEDYEIREIYSRQTVRVDYYFHTPGHG